jgi:hypothetical protein
MFRNCGEPIRPVAWTNAGKNCWIKADSLTWRKLASAPIEMNRPCRSIFFNSGTPRKLIILIGEIKRCFILSKISVPPPMKVNCPGVQV